MAIKIKPMTKAELRRYVASYELLFEDWSKQDGVGFFRLSGPFAQQVWFENLRSGAYRPVMTVSMLIMQGGATLHQFLDIKNRDILPRDHDRKHESVLNAMQGEFRPSITEPLDVTETIQMFVAQATERILDASSLASLYAYCGNLAKANESIAIVRQLAKSKEELFDWEQNLVRDTESLATAIESGNQEAYLAANREIEMARFTGKTY
ncbi:MAG: hypothetical protein ACK56W_10425 [Pirellula sp.]|jgi:hypothetical protein|nr:hypothetical protein [Pirellula sp.]